MKKVLISTFILGFIICNNGYAQTVTNEFYNVVGAVGNGFRLWSSDHYKIHLGYGANYNFGPVNNWAMKTNMFPASGRGWVWGTLNAPPVAAISTDGDMKIKGYIRSNESLIEHFSSGNYEYALSVWVDRDLTKAFTVNTIGGGNLFTIWGNGVVNAKRIYAEEISVQPDAMGIPWPDYVFEKGYKLPAIYDLEKFIYLHKHLPDVPSEKEVKDKGIDLAKMNAILLKKIEELTLYVIDQEKRISKLETVK